VNPTEQVPPALWTVGHSSRSMKELLALLHEARIEVVADVRRYPASRRHPHFDRAPFEDGLSRAGLRYLHLEGLGGHRTALEGSINTAFEEEAFNAYADHARSAEFARDLCRLERVARLQRTVVLCAEADPMHCHRRVLADVLQVRGWSVVHLLSPGRREVHERTPFARVEAGRVSYPGGRLF